VTTATSGPLSGLHVLEVAGIGPLPFACMVLADLGANVIRVDRPQYVDQVPESAVDRSLIGVDHLGRGRQRIAIDLKSQDGVDLFVAMAEKADVVLEGFRPGVMERLRLGPTEILARNPRAIYGRVSGWGRSGPMANAAGHDVNYIALAGVVDTLRPRGGGLPINPVGHIGDFGGGGMLLVVGVLAALYERAVSGLGQVVDSSILDGGLLLNVLSRYLALNDPTADVPGTNALDGGSHFFGAYATKDDKHIVFGALEPQFHDEMLTLLGIDPSTVDQHDRASWPRLRRRVAEIVQTRTRGEWQDVFEGTNACFGPVLDAHEVHLHPHHQARESFVEVDGQMQAAPAPRFSRTRLATPSGAHAPGADTVAVLEQFGISPERIRGLLERGVVVAAEGLPMSSGSLTDGALAHGPRTEPPTPGMANDDRY
jgi:alpha-methylacyl-CoA racemase